MTDANTEFKGLRAYLWPIHNFELKKFLPMALIMFCILFNYTVMRDTKDALVVNAAGSSAIIPFLKILVIPSAVLFVIIYAKLTNIFDNEKVFYVVVMPFLIFFGIFGFVLYPMVDYLHPSVETVKRLHGLYPRLAGWIDVYAYWTYSLFYVFSEIWGSAMIALMFWQYANRITRKIEAKRFYGFFQVIGNTSLMAAGKAVEFCSTGIRHYVLAGDVWGVSLKLICGLIVIMGILAMYLYWWMHRYVLTDPKYYDPKETKTKKKKEKPSLVESAKIIFTSPALGFIAILMIGYGVTINLVEVQWKHQLGIYFQGDKNAYNAFMGKQSFWTGIITTLFSWFIGVNILRRLPWIVAALITPLFFITAGGLFFAFILYKEMFHVLISCPIAGAVFLGVTVVVMSKSIKYALFDPTKEMAYMTLDEELQTKGKAAVDVIGGRAGKGGGAFVQAVLFMLLSTKDVILVAPYAFFVFVLIMFLWIVSVKGLNRTVQTSSSK